MIADADGNLIEDEEDSPYQVELYQSVSQLLTDLYDISDRFIDFKRGLFQVPSVKQR